MLSASFPASHSVLAGDDLATVLRAHSLFEEDLGHMAALEKAVWNAAFDSKTWLFPTVSHPFPISGDTKTGIQGYILLGLSDAKAQHPQLCG